VSSTENRFVVERLESVRGARNVTQQQRDSRQRSFPKIFSVSSVTEREHSPRCRRSHAETIGGKVKFHKCEKSYSISTMTLIHADGRPTSLTFAYFRALSESCLARLSPPRLSLPSACNMRRCNKVEAKAVQGQVGNIYLSMLSLVCLAPSHSYARSLGLY
jgi:hypothetical protein